MLYCVQTAKVRSSESTVSMLLILTLNILDFVSLL